MRNNIILLIAFVCSLQISVAQNVGIGTTTPLYPLHLQTPSNLSTWGFMHTNGNVYLGSFIYQSGIAEFGTRSNHPFYLFANNNDNPPAIAIDNSGINVGIGNTSPLYNLDIHSAGNAQLNLREGIGGQTALFSRYSNRLEIQPSDALEISVGGIDKRNLCVANNGYVGISTSTPTNYLQVGSYTNANFGGNQLAFGFGTNVTVLNQYASLSNFQTTSALNIQSGNGGTTIQSSGDINLQTAGNLSITSYVMGINSFATTAPLNVGTNFDFPYNNSFHYYDGAHTTTNLSIFADGGILAEGFLAFSDARIKNIEGVSNSFTDLNTLNKIEITNYTLKDKARNGDKPFKKVIAQQVETVYPQVVSRHVDFIPNVYQATDKINKTVSGYVLTFDNGHHLSKDAKRIKLLASNDNTMKQYNIVSILSDKEVLINAPDLNGDKVFVYGEEVNDFRTVDYEGLTTLNISATQELSKLLKEQQELVKTLSEKVDTLEKKLNQLENKK